MRATKGGEVGTREPWSPDGLRRLGDLYEPLRRFAAVVGKWDVEPDDLVQEAYTRVLARPEDGIDDLGPYLRRAIVNAATDERRRARRRADLLVRAGSSGGSLDSYPSELADLMRLAPRTRALLYLVEVEGQRIADAAEVLDMTHATARVALARARRRLRLELTVEMNDE